MVTSLVTALSEILDKFLVFLVGSLEAGQQQLQQGQEAKIKQIFYPSKSTNSPKDYFINNFAEVL